jgi:hypothetical protein
MASYIINTTARQDEILTRVLAEVNLQRTQQGQPPLPDVQTMIRQDVLATVQIRERELRQRDRQRIADAFDNDETDATVRTQVRALLGVS